MEFRTGPYRLEDLTRVQVHPNIVTGNLADADEAVAQAVFDIDELCTTKN
jgi:hypothetical protein